MARKSNETKVIDKLENKETNFPSVIQSQPLEVQTAAIELIRAATKKIGMGLEDYLLAIKNGLVANKSLINKFGDVYEEVDHATRLKAAAMGLEVEGYMKAKGQEGIVNNYFDVKTLVQEFNRIK